MTQKERTKKLEQIGESIREVFEEEVEATKEDIKRSTIDNADDMDQVRGARIALKYFDKLKRRIHRPASNEEEKDFPLPSFE